MKNYSNAQTDVLVNFLNSKKENIANGHQGSSISQILGESVIKELASLNVPIESISVNYYACEGNAGTMNVCAIKIDNGNSSFGDYGKVSGFKFRIGDYQTGGHLSKYASLGRADETKATMTLEDVLKKADVNAFKSFVEKTPIEGNQKEIKMLQKQALIAAGITNEIKMAVNESWSWLFYNMAKN